MAETLSFDDVPAMVAIPVRDEVERIPDCLLALDSQGGPALGIVLLVNNTTDGTVACITDLAPSLRCPVHVVDHVFPPECANAGHARRMAMGLADKLAPKDVPLLTTDADGRVAPGWLACNLWHLRHGLDAVFGRAVIDPVEAAHIPPALREADARECAYAAVLDQIETLVDPDPHDPWPRHTERSGASIAVSRQAFRTAGGIPAVPLGEDRAFYLALRRIDARIIHARDVEVVVSGRILGRADGGMADTIRRRLAAPDTMLDDVLEPVSQRIRRVELRRAARLAFQAGAAPGPFGAAWSALDAVLARERVAVVDLGVEMAAALAVRDQLMAAQTVVA